MVSCIDELADQYLEEKDELAKLQNQVLELRSAKIELLEKLQASSSISKSQNLNAGKFESPVRNRRPH